MNYYDANQLEMGYKKLCDVMQSMGAEEDVVIFSTWLAERGFIDDEDEYDRIIFSKDRTSTGFYFMADYIRNHPLYDLYRI